MLCTLQHPRSHLSIAYGHFNILTDIIRTTCQSWLNLEWVLLNPAWQHRLPMSIGHPLTEGLWARRPLMNLFVLN